MRFRSLSLGAKLNLALLAFFLVLGVSTLTILVYGFGRTQDHATARSTEALEEEGKLALQALAGGLADSGSLQFESAAEVGQHASRYMQDFKAQRGAPRYDVSGFVRTADGVWYDPDPARISDVAVVNQGQLEGQVLDDIAYSAALDPLFPALAEGFPGQISDVAFDPIAITFVAPSGVGRIYPPIGVQETTEPVIDLSGLEGHFGPEANPTRETLWTPPYEDAQGRGLVMTAQTPVYEGDVFRGIIEVDLSIAKLVELINGLKPTPSGFTFYVDTDGAVLQTDSFDLLSGEAENNQELVAVLHAMGTPMEQPFPPVEKLTLGGEEYMIAHTPMAMPGGSVGAGAPIDEITAQASLITAGIEDEGDRTFLIILAAMGALFVAGLISATVLNRRLLITPLRRLATATQAVAAGDLDTRVELKRTDEIGTLGAAFNSMVEELRRSESVLERRVEERTQELGALLEVSRVISSTLELQPLLDLVLDEVKKVVPYDGAAITLNVGDELHQVAVRRPPGYEGGAAHARRVTRRWTWRESEERLELNQAVIIRDVMDDSAEAKAYRESWGGDLSNTSAAWVRSMIVIPLGARDRSIGNISIGSKQTNFFTSEHVKVVQAVAGQAAAAIENARLYEETQQSARETEALLEVASAVVSTLDLRELMGVILDQLKQIIEHTGSALITVEGGDMVIRDARSLSTTEGEIGARISLSEGGVLWDAVLLGDCVIIRDIRSDEPYAESYRAAINSIGLLEQPPFSLIRSWMAVPLAAKGEVFGMLSMSWTEPNYFTDEHARLAGAFAGHVALAIENARLFDRGNQIAALEERQRLARELHDSVSQALYGIALGARTARTQLDRDPANAVEPVDYVLSLAEAGLAEMRALIFELRPESLESEGLVAALDKQIAATRARYEMAIEANLCAEPDVPVAVKEAFYRIGQEALHNIVKHAQATHIRVALSEDSGVLRLKVEDNGIGFDPVGDFPGHLGLRSMTERAENCGGALVIESTPGSGSRVTARFPTAM